MTGFLKMRHQPVISCHFTTNLLISLDFLICHAKVKMSIKSRFSALRGGKAGKWRNCAILGARFTKGLKAIHSVRYSLVFAF